MDYQLLEKSLGLPGSNCSNGILFIGIVNGANDAFADDAFLNKLDHEAEGILCTFAVDSKLVESALHAGSLHSISEKAWQDG